MAVGVGPGPAGAGAGASGWPLLQASDSNRARPQRSSVRRAFTGFPSQEDGHGASLVPGVTLALRRHPIQARSRRPRESDGTGHPDTPPIRLSAHSAPAGLAALLRIHQTLHVHRDCAALFAALAGALGDALPVGALIVLVPAWRGDDAQRLRGGRRRRGRDRSATRVRRRRCWRRSRSTARRCRSSAPRVFAALPLLARGECLGALGFVSDTGFDAALRRLLDEIAAAVAIAVDHCLGYEDLERSRREHAALLDVNRAIGRHLHRDELFGALAGCLREIVPTERFGIELPIEGDRLQGHLLTPPKPTAADGGALPEPTTPTVLPAPGTACDWVLRNREWIVTASREELRTRFPITFEIMEREHMEALCALPLVTGDRCRGVLFFMNSAKGAYARLHRTLLEQVGSAVAAALDDCLAHEEVRHLRDKLAAENLYLQEEIRSEHNFVEIVGQLTRAARRAARDRAGGGDRRDRADPRRNRHRQGADRARDPRSQPAP